MHIPDNYLSPATCAVMAVVAIPVLAVSVKKVKEEVTKEKMPLLGVGAAFSFLMMMFNVPLPGGTTGHAVGGTLIAILLGPYSACISVSVALIIQAFLFGDGGILALGANIFNMAIVIPFVGYLIYSLIKKAAKGQRGEYISAAVGSYLGINVAALCAAIEFGIQPLLFKDAAGHAMYSPYPLSVSIPAMIIPHLLVAGVVEVIFTVLILVFIRRVSPGTIYEGEKKRSGAVYGLIGALIVLTPIGLLAAGTAWGEWGADEISQVTSGGSTLGYVPSGMENGIHYNALMPDYALNGLPDFVGYILSAIVGVALMIIIFRIVSSIKKDKPAKRTT